MPFFYDASDTDGDAALAEHIGVAFGEDHGGCSAGTNYDSSTKVW